MRAQHFQPSNISTMVYVEHNEQDRYRFTKKGNYNANFQLSLTENERFYATHVHKVD